MNKFGPPYILPSQCNVHSEKWSGALSGFKGFPTTQHASHQAVIGTFLRKQGYFCADRGHTVVSRFLWHHKNPVDDLGRRVIWKVITSPCHLRLWLISSSSNRPQRPIFWWLYNWDISHDYCNCSKKSPIHTTLEWWRLKTGYGHSMLCESRKTELDNPSSLL